MSRSVMVEMTHDDVNFVRVAIKHYEIFASQAEKAKEDSMAGLMRAQEFHGQQLMGRIKGVS